MRSMLTSMARLRLMEESAAMALDEVEDVDVDGEIEGEVVHGRKAAA